MEKKIGILLVALLVLGLAAAGAFAHGGVGKGFFQTNDAAKSALESRDYGAFTAAAESPMKNRQITEEQFNTLSEKYKEEAPRKAAMESARAAIENNDFAAWSGAMNTAIDLQKAKLTQENFNELVTMHEQMASNNSTRPMGMRKGHGGFGFGRN